MNRTNIDDSQLPHKAQEHAGPRRAERGPAAEQERAQRRKSEMGRLREVGRNLGGQIDEQVHKRPYVVLGAAIGIGFVAGSLFGSRLGQVLLAAGIGYAAKHALGGDVSLERIQAGIERLTGEAERRSGKA